MDGHDILLISYKRDSMFCILTIINSLRRLIELFTNFSLAYRQESYFAYLFGVIEPGFYGAIVRYDINKSLSFFLKILG